MTGTWDVRFPPPLSPVRSGDAIHERRQSPKRQRRKREEEHDPDHDKPLSDDDGQAHIDDYA